MWRNIISMVKTKLVRITNSHRYQDTLDTYVGQITWFREEGVGGNILMGNTALDLVSALPPSLLHQLLNAKAVEVIDGYEIQVKDFDRLQDYRGRWTGYYRRRVAYLLDAKDAAQMENPT